jgi:hypothetical protein
VDIVCSSELCVIYSALFGINIPHTEYGFPLNKSNFVHKAAKLAADKKPASKRTVFAVHNKMIQGQALL